MRQRNKYLNSFSRTAFCSVMALSISATMQVAAQVNNEEIDAEDAQAQTETVASGASARSSFNAAFFLQFAPQNAFEMVERLPGFSFDGGSDARGFGGTAGNVLIDGARPGSKNGLRNVLQRIPAAQVERIDVIRGGVGASDSAGQTVVANVIRIAGASTGTSIVRLVRKNDGSIRPQTETSYSTTVAGWETSSKLDVALRRQPRTTSFRRFDAAGSLTSSSEQGRGENFKWLWYTGEAGKDLFGGRLVFNTTFGGDTFDALTPRETFDGRLPDSSPDSLLIIDSSNDYSEFQLGADWTKTNANSWKIRMLGFTQLSWRDRTSLLTDEIPVGAQVFLSDFETSQDRIESIFRGTYSKVGSSRLKPEFGAEIAFNQLKSTFNLFEEDENGAIELDIPSANVKVAEIRAETFANLVWQAGDKLTIDGGLTFEFSRIRVTGDADNTQTFKFIKPTLNFTYNARDDLQFQLRASRSVGQLNFDDFAASNDAGDDRVLAGNPQLSPDQTWRLEGSIDWRFNAKGSLVITPFHEWRSDVLEQVILPSGGAGLGNAGSATFYGVETDLILPLDFILPGGRFEAFYVWRKSSLFDAIIGRNRSLSDINETFLRFEFRHDLIKQKFSWGLNMEGGFEEENFFANERLDFKGPYRFDVYVETTRFFGVKMRLEVNRFTGNTFNRDRFFFDPDRSGTFTGSELQRRGFGSTVRFEVTTQF